MVFLGLVKEFAVQALDSDRVQSNIHLSNLAEEGLVFGKGSSADLVMVCFEVNVGMSKKSLQVAFCPQQV